MSEQEDQVEENQWEMLAVFITRGNLQIRY